MSLLQLLGRSRVYSTFADLVGGAAREIYVREHVRARRGDRILDIGCGPGDILEFLPCGVLYTGFDSSADYIEGARKRFGPRGEFICREITPQASADFSGFDLVLANGVLHHLKDNDAKSLFKLARAALNPKGRLVTLDGCYIEKQSTIARLLLHADRGKFVRDAAGYTALARSVFPAVQASIRQDLMRIPYTHVILECHP